MAIATTPHPIGQTTDLPTLLADLRATRARAQSALVELRRAQHDSDARAAARAGGDSYKRVAGVSSLERAADTAERIIASADRQLASLSPMLELPEVSSGSHHWAHAR